MGQAATHSLFGTDDETVMSNGCSMAVHNDDVLGAFSLSLPQHGDGHRKRFSVTSHRAAAVYTSQRPLSAGKGSRTCNAGKVEFTSKLDLWMMKLRLLMVKFGVLFSLSVYVANNRLN